MKTQVSPTSITVYHNEIKGRTNSQNELVLKTMRFLGVASTANEIMEATKLYTDDKKPLEINKVTRVLNDLRNKKKLIDFINVRENKEGGRVVHHHFIKEVQTKLF
jgi:hypothetical protein